MKRKFLEDLGLEKDVVDQIMSENGKDVEAAKADLTTITTERDNLKKDLSDRDKQIEDLKKAAGDNEDLKNRIEQLQKDNKNTKVSAAVDLALVKAKAKNATAVKALLTDLDKADFNDDGTVKGLADQIKKLQESEDTKFLFDSEKPAGKPKGMTPAEPGDKKPEGITKADFAKMGYLERIQFKANNPEAYAELTGHTAPADAE